MKKLTNKVWIVLFWILAPTITYAQIAPKDSSNVDKKRLNLVVGGTAIGYSVTLLALNELWYSNGNRESFHFFNDNSQWLQVDKVGHMYSTYQLSSLYNQAFLWTGMEPKKSAMWGSIVGFGLMIPIEIMDGFSSEYGASTGDLLANFSGSVLFFGQHLLWKEIRIHPKFSFQESGLAHLRPELLGENYLQQILKDYNGQTYWFSFDISKFLKKGNNFPKWLNIAAGYGANEMVYANKAINEANGFYPYRQYYLGIDFDLSHIQSKSKFVNSVLFFVNMIHLPAPTIEFNKNDKIKFHILHW